ncbi:hypothetical protein N7509_000777 [Penicillium cosmopolitanum]|uniref:NmrA-like domain-containing protein n=1 Tax=Penicillium cosmopolitanum TaxID=1131564 RepID=A0A9W9WB40_9EURO|nr:uncharacterized protein N7509_000777 [Penicillium cosmopolitanum]KAJ5414150.1 hypothetical protein N7509_000777 [Penicillium cosmopolitanum]
MDRDVEYSQSKNFANVFKTPGVSHLILSSLRTVTEESEGRLTHVPHFDSKARVEQYIRDLGIDCSYILPGRAEDGSFQFFFPVGKQAKLSLFDAAQYTGHMAQFFVLSNKD